MKKIDQRKIQILKIIVEEYIRTGDITGSKSLLKKHNLQVSPATVRNDMMGLESMGLIFQPYNSAGRLPTPRGIRVFVDYLMETLPNILIREENIQKMTGKGDFLDNILYQIVSQLSSTTHEIAFGCIPTEGVLCYRGISHLLKKNEKEISPEIMMLIEMLEEKYTFMDLLEHLPVMSRVSVFFSDESLPSMIQDTALIVKSVQIQGHTGYLGILGSLKMDYAFNIASLRQIL